jgi:hypothetical protein
LHVVDKDGKVIESSKRAKDNHPTVSNAIETPTTIASPIESTEQYSYDKHIIQNISLKQLHQQVSADRQLSSSLKGLQQRNCHVLKKVTRQTAMKTLPSRDTATDNIQSKHENVLRRVVATKTAPVLHKNMRGRDSTVNQQQQQQSRDKHVSSGSIDDADEHTSNECISIDSVSIRYPSKSIEHTSETPVAQTNSIIVRSFVCIFKHITSAHLESVDMYNNEYTRQSIGYKFMWRWTTSLLQ